MIPRHVVFLSGLFLTVLLSGCVSTEALTSPPHINLSPASMSFAKEEAGQLDFGLDVSRNESDSLENLEVLPGLRVRAVRSGSVADLAGIRAGDVILTINGMETNEADVLAALAASSESEDFLVTARRGTTVYRSSMARPRQRQAAIPEELYRVDPLRSRAGYRTELIEVDGEPRTIARIAALYPESPIAAVGLEVGDVIVSVEQQGIDSAQALVNRIHAMPLGAELNLQFLPQSESARSESAVRDLQITLWEPERRISKLALWPLFRYESSLQEAHTRVDVLNLILFSLLSYERQQGEQRWRLLGLFEFGSGYGNLVEEGRAEN